ncbi:MAG: TetR/AcrR family transcriptional regulator [Candidatus Thermoplasmatota archaeon]|jgi:AcrR family transcriptional regulator|nr:TetR/AcrR family transcriptional regulator [Candidatus Thermoplasmatota archaeon]
MHSNKSQEKTDIKIIEATLKLLGKVGYGGITTREIAKTAGINEVTLFRKFGTKESLVSQAILHAQAKMKLAFEEEKGEKTGDITSDTISLALSLMELLAKVSGTVSAILFEARNELYMQRAAESMMMSALDIAQEFFQGYADELYLSSEDVSSISLSVVSFCFFRIVVRERILGSKLAIEGRKEELENHIIILLNGILHSQKKISGKRDLKIRSQGGE